MTSLAGLARPSRLCAWSSLLLAVLVIARLFDPVKQGLTATHFPTAERTAAPALTRIEYPSTASLTSAWQGRPPEVFSTRWSGGLFVARSGAYTIATESDDGSRVFVDDQLVVDNAGRHGLTLRSGSVELGRGVHTITIEFTEEGGGFGFRLLWGRTESDLAAMPRWALGSYPAGLAVVVASVVIWRASEIVTWLWLASLLTLAVVQVSKWLRPWTAALTGDPQWPALRWLLLASLALNAAGIWWGLPGSWVSIEISVRDVMVALGERFSHGWFDAYPPLHFALLATAMSPVLALDATGLMTLTEPSATVLLTIICRAVSCLAGVGILVAIYITARRTVGGRAGLFAVAIFALVAPFLYYAKTSNADVPYLFWWAVSLVFFLRVLDDFRVRDYALFAATGMLSICTKDQAYGLYVLLPLVIVHERWRRSRARGDDHPLIDATFNRGMAAAGAAAVLVFAIGQNVIFNWSGFVEHVQFIVGPGSVNYRAFEPGVMGQARLLGRTVFLIQESFGWPMFGVVLAGSLMVAVRPDLRRKAWWLVVSPLSYYVSFIGVVLYNYDRFVLPMCMVLAIFGGLALERLTGAAGPRRALARGLVIATLVYTLVYAGMVDVLMITDSRYATARWLAARATKNDLIGHTFDPENLPVLDGYRHTEIGNAVELGADRPRFYVLNADYARAIPPDSATAVMVTGLRDGSLGYRLAYRAARDRRWTWLPGGHPDLVGPRRDTEVIGILRSLSPAIEVFERVE